jgi:hypothetical protein
MHNVHRSPLLYSLEHCNSMAFCHQPL